MSLEKPSKTVLITWLLFATDTSHSQTACRSDTQPYPYKQTCGDQEPMQCHMTRSMGLVLDSSFDGSNIGQLSP